MPDVTNRQGYSKTDQPSQYGVMPTQPQFGNVAATTGAESIFFRYDLIVPYGMGISVSNPAQTTRLMPGWGLKVVIGLLCTTNMLLRFYVNSGAVDTTTFWQVDINPVAVTANSTRFQFITSPVFACAYLRGTLQAAASNSTVEYHVRLLDQ